MVPVSPSRRLPPPNTSLLDSTTLLLERRHPPRTLRFAVGVRRCCETVRVLPERRLFTEDALLPRRSPRYPETITTTLPLQLKLRPTTHLEPGPVGGPPTRARPTRIGLMVTSRVWRALGRHGRPCLRPVSGALHDGRSNHAGALLEPGPQPLRLRLQRPNKRHRSDRVRSR